MKTRVILIPHQNDLLVPHIAYNSFSCFLHHNLTNWGWGSIVADFWMLSLLLYFANVLLAFIYAAVSELKPPKAMAFAILGFCALSESTPHSSASSTKQPPKETKLQRFYFKTAMGDCCSPLLLVALLLLPTTLEVFFFYSRKLTTFLKQISDLVFVWRTIFEIWREKSSRPDIFQDKFKSRFE